MNKDDLLITRQFMAFITALFLYQKERALRFELPLGLDFQYNTNKSRVKLSRQASRIVKNSLGLHCYSNEIMISKPSLSHTFFNNCCSQADQYTLSDVKHCIANKIVEHFGGDRDLDNSAVVYLIHKSMQTTTPALTREALTQIANTMLYQLANSKTTRLAYGIKLKLKRERSSFTLIIDDSNMKGD
jgi:hypothetical protein